MLLAAAAGGEPTWLTILIAVIASGGGFGLLSSVITARSQKSKTAADAVQQLTASAVALVNELQERVTEAESEARSARDELRSVRRQLREASDEADALTRKMRQIREELGRESVSVPFLRSMVGVDPPPGHTNGSWHG